MLGCHLGNKGHRLHKVLASDTFADSNNIPFAI
jgi:hypothetical protein